MADKSKEEPQGAQPDFVRLEQLVKRAEELLAGVEANSNKAQEVAAIMQVVLGKATESQAKADNEALRANQAKMMVEEHSNAVAKFKGAIEADSAAISAKKAELEKLAQGIVNIRVSCDSDASVIADIKKRTEELNKTISEISGKATAIQANLLETKSNIDELAQDVKDDSKGIDVDLAKITSAKTTADNTISDLQKTSATTNELHERIKTMHSTVEEHEDEAKEKLESIKTLTAKAQEVEKKVVAYESSLAKLEQAYGDLKSKVEKLLPGATSAGLASSFCAQKTRFRSPQKWWMGAFILCMVALLGVAAVGSGGSFGTHLLTDAPDNWDSILRHLVQRLPYVVPLVWLGIYSGRQFMLALRLEEEYAFKEAISTAFEGYKREMGEIPANGTDVPLNTLCSNVLALLSRRPGLIYEGKHYDVTPLTPAVDTIEKIGPVIQQAVGVSGITKKQ